MVVVSFSEIVLALVYFISLYFNVFWLLALLDKNEPKKKHWKTLPTFSLLIPAYNEADTIAATLSSVLNLNYPKDKLKIYVINDGSKDKTKEIAEEIAEKNSNIILVNQQNGGKANALNNALKLVDSDFTATMDADSAVEKNAVRNLLQYFTDDDIASVIPAMKIKDPKNIIQRMQCYEYLVYIFYRMLNGNINCIHVTPGPLSVYRTSVLKELNGYDETSITEDLEIALRIQKKNYRILQTYDAEVYTIPPGTLKGLFYQRKRWFKGGFLTCIKHKDLMFNKSYGDFGLVRMPTMIILPFLTISMFMVFLNDIRVSITNFFNNLYTINFDVVPLIKAFEFNFNVLDLKFMNYSMVAFSIIFAIVILVYSHKIAKEKFTAYGRSVKSLAYYLFVHPIFIAFVLITVVYSVLFERGYKWYGAKENNKPQ